MSKAMISSSYMHHGKRLKLSVTYDDTGPESCKTAQEELNAMLRQRQKGKAAKVVAQSFRKKKTPKNG